MIRASLLVFCIVTALFALSACAGFSEQAIQAGDAGLDRLKEVADVVEASRCNLRPVGVLNRMAQERGPDWLAAYWQSCNLGNLKPTLPTLTCAGCAR